MQRDPPELREEPDGIKSFRQRGCHAAPSRKSSGHASHLCDSNDAGLTQICELNSLQNEFHPNKGYVCPGTSNNLLKVFD